MSQRPIPLDKLPPLATGTAGLDAAQVQSQRQFGLNDIVPEAASGWKVVLRDTTRDPMLWFLVLTAALFAWLGQTSEALTLVAALVPLVGMDAYLHRRTSASAAGLASRLASSARVLRDGQWQTIPSRELVPGDLVEVVPGEYFPADGLLVSGTGLQVDESTLTGESLPVAKRTLNPSAALPASAADEHWGMAGTRLLTGTACMRVACIGRETLYGEITCSASEGSQSATPLQNAIRELVLVLLGGAVVVCLALAAVRLWHGHGWIDALMSAVTLAVAALPEEFPVVYTFFLGMGVFRLARKKALVRRGVAVENIGRITCIVSDKTGTITEGALVLSHFSPAAGLNDALLLQTATLAARPDSGDPMDQALHGAAGALPALRRVTDFPFTEARRREMVMWATDDGRTTAYVKGAPETVLAMCDLTAPDAADWMARVDKYARTGHKVIASGWLDLAAGAAPATEPEHGFQFAGLLAFEDPVRSGVPAAIAECLAARMRVIMVTGDHPATAGAIAREIGLGANASQVAVLAPADDAGALLRTHADLRVVARATPPQKLALVKALQDQGELVAVTGDGVNDVPALRQADVGVAMGDRGTRSAREVAPVVLLDDNFRTIVDAVAEGRQLFGNLRIAFAYLLLVHLPLVVGAAAIPLMGLPLLFLPIHIVWLELVIHPTAMLAFQDMPASGPLAAVQRHRQARFFTADIWLGIVLIGGLVSAALVWSYLNALGADQHVEHARATALAMLVVASAAITAGLSRLHQATPRWIAAATLASLVVMVQVPPISRLLNLSPLHAADWAIVAASGVLVALATRVLAVRMGRYAL
jgi:Ca2+-transporting ATPase